MVCAASVRIWCFLFSLCYCRNAEEVVKWVNEMLESSKPDALTGKTQNASTLYGRPSAVEVIADSKLQDVKAG